MASSIEREISNLLRLLPTKNQVADELLKKWHRSALSNAEKDEVAEFLFHLGFHKSLLSEILYQMDKRAYVPVKVCLKLIDLYSKNLSLSKQRINAYYLWSESEGHNQNLIRMENLVDKDSRLEQLRNLAIDEDLGHSERQFQAKKRHAVSLVGDQIYDEADKLLNSLLELKPEDPELIALNKKLQYEKAVSIINKQQLNNQTQVKLPLFPWKSSAEKNDAGEIENSINELVLFQKEKPEWSFDVAIALFCIGEMDRALDLLEDLDDPRAFWLKIDIYLETRRFVQAIDEIENYKIDPSHKNFEEQNFSLLFLKAKAFWGSGQKDLALQHMEQIIKVRPDYRIAESLYRHWKDEASQ